MSKTVDPALVDLIRFDTETDRVGFPRRADNAGGDWHIKSLDLLEQEPEAILFREGLIHPPCQAGQLPVPIHALRHSPQLTPLLENCEIIPYVPIGHIALLRIKGS